MAKTFQCEIVSAKESIFSGQVEMLVATGSLGELGILPGHAPLLTDLKPGPVRLKLPPEERGEDGDEEDIFYASGGFIEVQPGVVTLLADTALRAADLDEASAEAAKQNAERALSGQQDDFQFSMAAAQLAEAAAQIRALRQYKGRSQGR